MNPQLVPTVGVIIPTYNRAHLVGRAIQSVLHQTYQDFNIIVVDDASTDNTEEIVKGFGDPRVHYLRHEQNRGAPWARNSGAEVARGEYLAFLDSDDIWYPELLERQLDALVGLPPAVGMVCCGILRKEGERRRVIRPGTLGMRFEDHLARADGINTSSFMVRKAAFQAVGGFDVKLNSFQDFDFLLRIAAKYRMETIDDVLVEYRIGKDSISLNKDAKAEGLEYILNCYKGDILRLGVMHRYFFRIGQYRVLSGRLRRGWLCWARALRYKPTDTKTWKHVLISLGGAGAYRRMLDLHRARAEQQDIQPEMIRMGGPEA